MSKSFNINEIVRKVGGKDSTKTQGIVKHLTCYRATKSGGKTCDRNGCIHGPKEHVWVRWPDGSLFSYKLDELEEDLAGEDVILNEMGKLLDTDDKEERDAATEVIQSILDARNNRIEAKKNKEVKETTMSSTGKSLTDMFKTDATNAAYRVAARQLNLGLKNAIVEMMKSKGANNSQIEGLAMFLETEWGSALIGSVVGYGLRYIPGLNEDPRVKRLSDEFRIGSMATVGNEIVGVALNQFLPVLNKALSTLPAEEKAHAQVSADKLLEVSKSPKSQEEDLSEDVDTSELESHFEEDKASKRMENNV